MSSNFFRLSARMQDGIANRLGWSALRAVQELAIEAILAGSNAIILAPTAGGKTEAAFFPVLDLVYRERVHPVAALYVSPLRALLNNQEPRLERLANLVGLTAFKWHGDVEQPERDRFLRDPAHVLLTTPESLEVMLMTPRIDHARLFATLRFVVIDEIHAFAAGDRGAHLVAVLERLQTYCENDIQRIGLSATVGDPEELARWQQGSSRREWVVINPERSATKRLIDVRAFNPETQDLGEIAAPLIADKKTLFFVEARRDAERAGQALHDAGVNTYVHHSSVSRERREQAEAQFTFGASSCIVCTSTMELGIDIGDLDLVLQLDAPSTVSSLMQRMGRTGRRAGALQHLVVLARDDDALLRATALLTLARRGWIEPVAPTERAIHVMVQQILAQAVAFGGVRRERLWDLFQKPVCFRGITRAEFERLIDHLLQTNILARADGLLTLGDRGEDEFGGRNFLALYSVFETPDEIAVVTTQNQNIGTLESWFVKALGVDEFVFVLAGRKWRTVRVDWENSVLYVVPGETGDVPKWLGGPRLLSRAVAEEQREVLLSDEEYPFLNRSARERLKQMRDQWRPTLSGTPLPLIQQGRKWSIHSWAGGRVNTLLAKALAQILNARTTNDNFIVTVEPAPDQPILDQSALEGALRQIAAADYFSPARLKQLAAALPRGRLSKFQSYLPPDLEAQFLIERLFDVEELQEVLCSAGYGVELNKP